MWRSIHLLFSRLKVHEQQKYLYTGLQIKTIYKPLHCIDPKPCSNTSRVWMKYEKKAPDSHLTAGLHYFACPDLLHESCLHFWWCYHCHVSPLQRSHLSLGQDRWVLQDSNKASKSDCESEKPQHTKLFSRQQISCQVFSTSHNPSLFISPPFTALLSLVCWQTDEPWSNFNRQKGKNVWVDCSHCPWQHFQVPE